MAELGNAFRLQLNTGTVSSPTWKSIASEVSVSFDQTSDKVEVANKAVGKFKSFKKLRLTGTLNVTAHEDPTNTTDLGYPDLQTYFRKNNTDTDKGIFPWRLNTSTVGEDVIAFDGFIESLGLPTEDQGLITYTFSIQITSQPTLTPVA